MVRNDDSCGYIIGKSMTLKYFLKMQILVKHIIIFILIRSLREIKFHIGIGVENELHLQYAVPIFEISSKVHVLGQWTFYMTNWCSWNEIWEWKIALIRWYWCFLQWCQYILKKPIYIYIYIWQQIKRILSQQWL